MKLSILILAIALTFVSSAGAQSRVSELSWMTGCWNAVGGESGSGELWTAPAGGTLFGVNRTVRNSKTVAHEFMQIRETDSGGIEFIASPSGQAGATFAMIELSLTRVVFENPEHDFPQRIVYSLSEEGNLVGSIEGLINGQARTVDFPFAKATCLTG